MEFHTTNGEELQALGGTFALSLKPGPRATVVTLSGDLGAGKTTFTQGVASALGVSEEVTSPTFVIEKIYPLTGQKFARLIHIDAYRLHEGHELEVLGFKELLNDGSNLILLEWPEQVPGIVPEEAIRIRFTLQGEGRSVEY